MFSFVGANVFVVSVYLSCLLMMRCTVSSQGRSGRSCRWNQITFLKPSGAECFNCPECPEGQGLDPQCGSSVPAGAVVQCVLCEAGEVYSDKHDISSCKPCTICDPNEETISPCTATKNAVCGKCKAGYYRAVTGDCHPCSWCCVDSTDEEKEKQCSEQTSLSANQVCRYDVNTIKCAPKTSSTAVQVRVTSAVTKPAGSEGVMARVEGEEKENNLIWLVAIGGFVALAVSVMIGLLYICHRKNEFLSQLKWNIFCVNTRPTQPVSADNPPSPIVFGTKSREGQMV